MLRSHHITLILADERRRELTRLAETGSARHPAPQPKQVLEDRFLEPVEHDPAPSLSPPEATIRVGRPKRGLRSRDRVADRSVRERELDHV